VSRADIDWKHFAIIRTDRGVQQLTRLQWRLFETLHAKAGEIVSDARLIEAVWARRVPHEGQIRGLTVLAHHLRQVLAGSRWAIVRHRSRGYELVRIEAPRQQPRGRQAENGVAIQA
jgi:DNA-binding response OmpR family regulator